MPDSGPEKRHSPKNGETVTQCLKQVAIRLDTMNSFARDVDFVSFINRHVQSNW